MKAHAAFENDEVFEILRRASALYDRYVDLARLSAAAALTEATVADQVEVECSQPDLSHPLGVVIDTAGAATGSSPFASSPFGSPPSEG